MMKRFLVTTALAGAGPFAAPALAQSTNETPDAPQVGTAPVPASSDDIIVTATKRRESIRAVPLAISAITGDQLAKANADSLSDYITRLSPDGRTILFDLLGDVWAVDAAGGAARPARC